MDFICDRDDPAEGKIKRYRFAGIRKKTMKKIPDKYRIWIDTRKKFHLSHAQVQMARELGMNPKKFGKSANHKQEPWKLPLGRFIERIYLKHFKKPRPDPVRSIEELVKERKKTREAEKRRRSKKAQEAGNEPQPTLHIRIKEST